MTQADDHKRYIVLASHFFCLIDNSLSDLTILKPLLPQLKDPLHDVVVLKDAVYTIRGKDQKVILLCQLLCVALRLGDHPVLIVDVAKGSADNELSLNPTKHDLPLIFLDSLHLIWSRCLLEQVKLTPGTIFPYDGGHGVANIGNSQFAIQDESEDAC